MYRQKQLNQKYNFYLDGITKSGNTLTFSVNGATNQSYTFGSNAFTSYTDHSTQGYLTSLPSHNHNFLQALGDYVWNASTNGRDFPLGIQTSFVSSGQSYPSFGSVVRIATYTGINDGATAELYFPYSATYGGSSMRYRLGVYNNAGWTGWKTVIDSDSIGSQSVSYATSAGNADTLDGVQGSQFFRSDVDDTISGNPTFAKGSSGTLASRTGYSDFLGYNPSYGSYIGGRANNASGYIYAGGYYSDGSTVHTLIHSGNHTSYTDSKYLRSDTSDTMSGNLTIAGDVSSYNLYVQGSDVWLPLCIKV